MLNKWDRFWSWLADEAHDFAESLAFAAFVVPLAVMGGLMGGLWSAFKHAFRNNR